jgi:hypothetical protein
LASLAAWAEVELTRQQHGEVAIAILALNRMLELGRPKSVRIA